MEYKYTITKKDYDDVQQEDKNGKEGKKDAKLYTIIQLIMTSVLFIAIVVWYINYIDTKNKGISYIVLIITVILLNIISWIKLYNANEKIREQCWDVDKAFRGFYDKECTLIMGMDQLILQLTIDDSKVKSCTIYKINYENICKLRRVKDMMIIYEKKGVQISSYIIKLTDDNEEFLFSKMPSKLN